jgi:predicted nuclease of restriction endonuclease-like (RecB) superfamily
MEMNKAVKKSEKGYTQLISGVGLLLEKARKDVYYSINQVLVKTYWEIGRRIVEFEQGGEKAEYGSGLLDKLSMDLTEGYGKGFSAYNLRKIRSFYLSFRKWATVSPKLSWSHYRLIMRLDDELAMKFYIKEVESEGWSTRELDRQINSRLFERIALSKDKQGVLELASKGQLIEKTADLIKDPYILEFLDLEEAHHYSESDLEKKLITYLEKFLLELGKGFTFVSRQQRITLEDEHFYIDLVFYNRLLRCFVLMELKIGKLTHKDLGQLQMYVNYYDRKIKKKDENMTIGILLCADKREAIIEFTLPKDNKQVFASKYKLYLPNKKELEEKVRKILA